MDLSSFFKYLTSKAMQTTGNILLYLEPEQVDFFNQQKIPYEKLEEKVLELVEEKVEKKVGNETIEVSIKKIKEKIIVYYLVESDNLKVLFCNC